MPSKLKATGTLYQQMRKGNSLKKVKGINNNTVADAISQLDFSSKAHPDKRIRKYCAVEDSQKQCNPEFTMDLNHVYLQIAVTKKKYTL